MTTRSRATRGFTLIELLVAIAVMALLAIMSWRGLEGMAQAQSQLRGRADAVLTLQGTLSQWGADLDASITLPSTRPIDWDGKTLRLTRQSSDGGANVFVVAWTLRSDDAGSRWHRWQSPPIATRGDWQQAWAHAAAWAQNDGSDTQGSDVALMPVQDWQVLYFRNNAWSPATSADALGGATTTTATTATTGNANSLPDGVRLVLTLPPGPALTGVLTRDWVRPTVGGAKG